MKSQVRWASWSLFGLLAAQGQGGWTVQLVPVGSSTIGGGQQISLEVHVTSDVDQEVRAGQVDLPCVVNNGTGSLTSFQVLGDSPSDGIAWMCQGGLVAVNQNDCRVAQTRPLGGPPCFLPANQSRYMATIRYEVSDCAEGSFQVGVESYTLPPVGGNSTRFIDGSGLLIPITTALEGQLNMGPIGVGACCDGNSCLADGIYAGCCAQTHPGAEFYAGKTCTDLDPCRGPCCLPDGGCQELDAASCGAQGGTSLPASQACEAPVACCLSIGVCQMLDPSCCSAQGGAAQGPGSSCDDLYACCTAPSTWQLLWTEPWTAPGKVRGSNLEGGNVAALVSESGKPRGIAVDRAAGKVYWTSVEGSQGFLRRASLDGSAVEELAVLPNSSPSYLALDTHAGKMYWTDLNVQAVRRANLNGSSVETVVEDIGSPSGIAVDAAGSKVYWGNEYDHKIRRANLDGSGTEILLDNRPGRPQDIALDLMNGRIYWNESASSVNPPTVNRASLDGSAAEVLLYPGNSAFGLDLDVTAGKMYWAAGKVQRASLDGSLVEDLVTAVSAPFGLALALPLLYGDMDENQIIDVDDISCVVGGFVNPASCPGADIHPCGGNQLVDVDDVTAMLDVFIQFGSP